MLYWLKILYCFNILKEHVEDEESYLGMIDKKKSGSVVRYSKNKVEKPDEDQLLEERLASYQRSKNDVERIEKALKRINGKKGYEVIQMRYLQRKKINENGKHTEDIYTFDLAKNIKKEINNISAFLNTIKTNLFEGLEKELESSSKDRVFEALDVILNFGKVEFSNDIKETIEKTQYEDVISEGIKVLKSFNRLDLIQKDETIAKLKNENIKAIILSTFS